MYLIRIWNKSKGPMLPLLASLIPSVLGIWNFDFQKLSPGETLSLQSIYNIRLELTTWFLIIAFFLLSIVFIYVIISIERENKESKSDLSETINFIKKSIENNYTIHQRSTLSPNIEKSMNDEAGRGFSIPQGSLAGRLFDIYLNEVSVYCSMLRECILSFSTHSPMQISSPEFINLIQELVIAHNKRLKNFHNRQITDMFTQNSSSLVNNMVSHFSNQVDAETKLRCNELLSALKIKNLTSCDEMDFQPWEPIVRKKPKPHTFVEEDETLKNNRNK